MDPFVAIVMGGLALLVLAVLALGLLYPGSGAEQVDWRPTRSPELEARNEVDDHVQMLDAINARRRSRGEADLDPAEIDRRVAEDRLLRRRLQERGR
jgi:hypothetical protein